MKLRKNLLVGTFAAVLALAGVACGGGGGEETATEGGADTGATEMGTEMAS